LLIRHAESVGNAESRLQGQEDFPLTERGVKQARLLADRLAACDPPSAIYASPLSRTRLTAAPLAAALGLPVCPLPGVMEYDFGTVSGLTWREIGERYPELIAAVRARTPKYPCYPGEEGRASFRQRVCGSLWDLAARFEDEERVAVFTHGGPIVVFCLSVLDLPYQRPAPFAVHNASITQIEVRDGSGTLLSTNDICHLTRAED
jgi:broad specificity phosphatase PhoE